MVKKIIVGLSILIVVGSIAGFFLFKSSYNEFQDRAKEGMIKATLMSVYTNVEIFRAETGEYPASLDNLEGFTPPGEVQISYQKGENSYTATGTFKNITLEMNEQKEFTRKESELVQ